MTDEARKRVRAHVVREKLLELLDAVRVSRQLGDIESTKQQVVDAWMVQSAHIVEMVWGKEKRV